MPRAFPIRLAAGCLAVLFAIAIACGDPLAPQNIAGTYTLQRVDNDPLPTVLLTTESVRVRVLADTLSLNADGSGIQISVWETEPLVEGIAPENPVRIEAALRFETAGGRVEVTVLCPPNANCTPPPHLLARTASEGLRVDFASGQRVPLRYARVRAAE